MNLSFVFLGTFLEDKLGETVFTNFACKLVLTRCRILLRYCLHGVTNLTCLIVFDSPAQGFAMSSVVDSGAHFDQRLLESGITQAVLDAIKLAGVDTLSRLAFAVGQPNQPLSNDEINQFLQRSLGRAPSLLETSTIKRIAFEAQTFLVASLRQTLEQTDETQPRKIAFAERTARMEALKGALLGVNISGESEPSHNLLDRACSMYDKNVITYLEPSTCVSRTLEVQGAKLTRELSLEKGSLVLKNQDSLSSATDSEIKLHFALLRRGIALQFAKLMSHAQRSEWVVFLYEALHRDPPPGYSRCGLGQLIQCDKAAWSRLGSTVQQVRQDTTGQYPLGLALLALRSDPYIALHLAPVARAQSSGGDSWSRRPAPYQSSSGDKGHKGKGKGKKGSGKGAKGTPAMPKDLHGKWHRTPQGEAICFGFNTSAGCPEKGVKPGEKCRKGLHVCAEPRCQQNHPLQDHGK